MPQPKKPVSEKQLAANRANAASSTGPCSPEGKARSAQNSRKHGFTASAFAVVRLEDIGDVARLRQDAIATYRPVNSQELFAIERIAITQQALLRADRLQSGLFTTCLNEALDGHGRPLVGISPDLVNGDVQATKVQTRNYLLAEGFHRLIKYCGSWPLFMRYQVQTERLYRRAVEEFERLKALRNELPNEPILEAQPEQNLAASDDAYEPISRFGSIPEPTTGPPAEGPPPSPQPPDLDRT